MYENVQLNRGTIILPEGYKPGEVEEYMNPVMLEYFRQKLLRWKDELQEGSGATRERLLSESELLPDVLDQAMHDSMQAVSLRTRDRERKLIYKIEQTLDLIGAGNYGYCEDTGEEIGVRRLEARPTASLCLSAQEKHEWEEKNSKRR